MKVSQMNRPASIKLLIQSNTSEMRLSQDFSFLLEPAKYIFNG
jgi:hypothetical protein